MNVKLTIDGTLALGADPTDDGEQMEYDISVGHDYDPKAVAEMLTLAELNMLRTHLATFDAVLEGAIDERGMIISRANLKAGGPA